MSQKRRSVTPPTGWFKLALDEMLDYQKWWREVGAEHFEKARTLRACHQPEIRIQTEEMLGRISLSKADGVELVRNRLLRAWRESEREPAEVVE